MFKTMHVENTMISRRNFSRSVALGATGVAMQSLLASQKTSTGYLNRAATAKRIIYLFMSGGPSQVDTFDPKPDLVKLAGQDVPDSIAADVPRIKRAGLRNLLPSPWKFQRHGDSGMEISELFPELAKNADDLCVIRSMSHRNPVHGPGECVALTGSSLGNRPSVGSWALYGLGVESQQLPTFIAMNVHNDGMQYPQAAGWGSGFLPAKYQGTLVNPSGGIRNALMPEGISSERRRREMQVIHSMNQRFLQEHRMSELEARMRSYETAFAMQTAGPELFDLSTESSKTKQSYGFDEKATAEVGKACLLARRMVERGVPYVQIRVGGWDAHSNLKGNHQKLALRTDAPISALLRDLSSRGLLNDTLVVWSGEFGRTPTMEGKSGGRDHSPAAYSVWLAGGGVKGGQVIGSTDPIGYTVTESEVKPTDLHATILHAMGLDADRLIYPVHGLEETPLGVNGGQVVSEVFG
ncbi:DUF1501 domain-containing protein [bacterium]|nr:DUF1501 domain-containing protein [bacterium]